MPTTAGEAWVPFRGRFDELQAQAIATITKLVAEMSAIASKPITATVEADTAGAVAQVAGAAAAMQAIASKPITFTMSLPSTAELAAQVAAAHAAAGLGGGGGGGAAAAAAAAASGGGGGGGGGGGILTTALLSKLLWGGGGAFGLAGAGSLASFAGLGPEHVLMTLLGLGGFAAGGVAGAGLLGLGAAGTMAVGSGSDAAVMKSTIADTKTLYTAYQALQLAVAQYGAGSTQAAAATAALNAQMSVLGNTAGVQAEMGLAKSTAALNAYWDAQTSGARVAAVSILQQGVTLANEYIPLVANAAQRNLTIISADIKPLFAWLEGPQGVGIFQNLENIFAHNLPTAVDAFTQAVELLLKTINYLAPSTGGFMKSIDDLLTRANSPSGFARWEQIMQYLIKDFDLWWDVIKNLGRDLYDLFSRDAGTAQAIVTWLDQMLIKIGQWERSTQGQAQLHSVFEVHKQEIIALLNLLPPLVEGFGRIYLTLAPQLAGAFTMILQHLVPLLDAIASNPFGADVLGISLILGKIGLLGTTLQLLLGPLARIAAAWLGVATAADTAAASEVAADAAGAGAGASGVAGIAAKVGASAWSLPAILGNLNAIALALGPEVPLSAGAIAGGLFAASVLIEKITGHADDLNTQFSTMVNPVSKMLTDLDVSQSASAALRAALVNNGGTFDLAMQTMTQSAGFTSQNASRQQLIMQDLATALQQGMPPTFTNIANFATAWSTASTKALGLPPTEQQTLDALNHLNQQMALAIAKTITEFTSAAQKATLVPPSIQAVDDAINRIPPPTTNIERDLAAIQTLTHGPLSTAVQQITTTFAGSVPPVQQTNQWIQNLLGQVTTSSQAAQLLQGHLSLAALLAAPLDPSQQTLTGNVTGAGGTAGSLWSIFGNTQVKALTLPNVTGGLLNNIINASGAASGLAGAFAAVGRIVGAAGTAASKLLHFAGGGHAIFPDTGALALMHGEEYVLTKSQVASIPGLESVINMALSGVRTAASPVPQLITAAVGAPSTAQFATGSSGDGVMVHAPINITVNGWTQADVIPALQREMQRQISDFHGRALALVRAKGG